MSAVVENNLPTHAGRVSKERPTPTSQEKIELMRRRLDLIPTCIWEDEKEAVKTRAGDGPLFNSNVKVKISWTNIKDIELYVKSNLRSFTEKGGIALFLETLVRIHGNDYIARQLNRCAVGRTAGMATGSVLYKFGEDTAKRNVAAMVPETGNIVESVCTTTTTAGFPSLIRCTCEDRQKRMHEEKPLPLNVRVDPSKLLDTTPSGTECVSVELLTLILMGRISSDWKDCSSEKLGLGLLTETIGEVSHGLARPKKPVWLLKGETCYTVLNIEGSWNADVKGDGSRSSFSIGSSNWNDLKTISMIDKPGVPLNLCHWNGWYGQRNKTSMRLVTATLSKAVPSKKILEQFSEPQEITHMRSQLMRRRRYENAINVASIDEHKSNEVKGKETFIYPQELERIMIHKDDQKLYPQNHKMWRFDLPERNDNVVPAMDQKLSSQHWIPYFQLTSRQKRIVERKLGPRINTIIWTRWPEALIDNYSPNDGQFPVV